ncbi:EAL domain-containing protein [Eubacteriaceae bacterium ES3]|nr:EAL domain-containing protein [Eubacteriaceae bacterium ES3]
MKRLTENKLSIALMVPIVITVFAVLMVFTGIDAYRQKLKMTDNLYNEAEKILSITADAAENAFWTYNEPSLVRIGETVASYQEVASVVLLDEDGNIVYEHHKNGESYDASHLLPQYKQEIVKNGFSIGQVRLQFTNFYLTQSIKQAILQRIAQTLVIIFLILLLIMLLSRKLSMALDRVAGGVTEFTQGNRETRISVDGGDEIKNLAQRINEMFEVIVRTSSELNENYKSLKIKEEALRISEERFRYAVDGSNDAVWDWDVVNDSYYLSRRGFQIVGLMEEEVISMDTWKDLIHSDDRANFERFLERLKISEYGQIEFRMVGSTGEIHWVFGRGKGILDDQNQLIWISGFYTDITERIKAEEAINRLAYYDVLTGLPNRTKLLDYSKQLLTENKNGALLYVDIDDFKTINDTKGHSAGDKLLKGLANKLDSTIEKDMIARIAGDELIVIRKNCDMMQASRLANEIMNIISQPFIIDNFEFIMSCSIGITMFPEDGTDINRLMMNADSAMYLAKQAGKDQFKFFEASANEIMVRKIEMQYEIRHGIQNDEFVLYYQPQIDLTTGLITGVEALVRWMHPQRGLISPFEFIPLAEESGLIVPLGEMILRKACQQSAIWENGNFPGISISVNYSGRQLNRKNIVDETFKIIEQTGMKPELLDIEITESVAMENLEHIVSIIRNIKAKGVKFSLDDFGTGYSSLNYLHKLPIDHLKIDKQFVQSIETGNFEEVVIKATVEIAHSMNLIVVAEGVETKAQYEVINGFGADQIQGYYFGKPMPAEKVQLLFGKSLLADKA